MKIMKQGFGISIRKKSKLNTTNIHRYSIPYLVDRIIEQADIILEILDARFIEETRNIHIENEAKKLGKIVIYVLNKSDLVDVNKLKRNKEFTELNPIIFFSCRNRKGVSALRRMIKIKARDMKKEAVSVGVIGYPNTGKSSIINLLTGRAAARTSPEAGFTKGVQKVRLASNLYLIDSPGLIPLNETSGSRGYIIKHLQIGAKTWDKAYDPDMVINKIMKENPGLLEDYYKIEAEGDSEVLIEQLGRKLYYLKKGNLIDSSRVARQILRDWQEGKIKVNKLR